MSEIFESARVRRALVVKLRAIGDSVLSLPSVHALADGLPGARVSVLVPGHSRDIFSADPRVDETIVYPRERLRSARAHADFFELLQRRRYDLVVCLHASFRTAFLGWMTGAPWRSVRNHSGRDWFCNLPASEPKEAKSIIQRDFDAIRALGLSPADRLPSMSLAAGSIARAATFWKQRRLGPKVVALMPGAGKPEKAWPKERFARLGAMLKKKGYTPLPLLAPGENAGELDSFHPASFESLQDLAAVMARCAGAVGNDSGPRHLAAAVGTRTLTLFGPEGRREWHPYPQGKGHWTAKSSSGRVEDIQVEPLFESVKEWLAQKVKN